jgi:hypothetical protein
MTVATSQSTAGAYAAMISNSMIINTATTLG